MLVLDSVRPKPSDAEQHVDRRDVAVLGGGTARSGNVAPRLRKVSSIHRGTRAPTRTRIARRAHAERPAAPIQARRSRDGTSGGRVSEFGVATEECPRARHHVRAQPLGSPVPDTRIRPSAVGRRVNQKSTRPDALARYPVHSGYSSPVKIRNERGQSLTTRQRLRRHRGPHVVAGEIRSEQDQASSTYGKPALSSSSRSARLGRCVVRNAARCEVNSSTRSLSTNSRPASASRRPAVR